MPIIKYLRLLHMCEEKLTTWLTVWEAGNPRLGSCPSLVKASLATSHHGGRHYGGRRHSENRWPSEIRSQRETEARTILLYYLISFNKHTRTAKMA